MYVASMTLREQCYCTSVAAVIMLLLAVASVPLPSVAQSVEGRVFLDQNANGRLDAGEVGVEGVMVSNQREVVLTDDQGNYAIDVQPGQSVMVTKPAAYDLPLNAYGIPQFSATHEPEGSPTHLRYGGLRPSSLASEGPVNFPLLPGDTTDTFRALIFGDPQPRDHKELTYVRDTFIEQASTEEASFMIVLGDVMYDDLSLIERYKALVARTEKPIWHVVGNHDLDLDAEGNRHARDTFRQHFGANYYAFEQGEVLFVMLDNVDYMGTGEDGNHRYRGAIWGDQLRWLRAVLEHIPESQLIVVGTHIPVYAWGGEAENVNTVNRDALFEALSGRERVLLLSGHLHMTYQDALDADHGWTGDAPIHQLITTTVSGTWWGGPVDESEIPIATQRDGVPNGYHRFAFNGSAYREQLIGLGEPEDVQIRIETVFDVPNSRALPDTLIVNVFNGSAANDVRYRVEGKSWIEMNRVTGPSPYYEKLLERYPSDWSPNLTAIPTNHLWTADFPEHLEPGTYRIDVQTTDRYGSTWTHAEVIEVQSGPQ